MHVVIAVSVMAVVGFAEWLHARRVARVARLAFGAPGRPASWVRGVGLARCISAGLATWGALVLVTFDPIETDTEPKAKASKQLLICLDVSPSMQIKDAGPGVEKISRAAWSGKLVQGILDRLDMKETRISLVAFYTDALTVLHETYDKNVVSNVLDGLPMHVAFEAGATELNQGIDTSFELARPWARRSATLLIITDGDATGAVASRRLPISIADTIVLGVGDPNKSSLIAGHASRQDAAGLREVAGRLGGHYHQGNEKHLPSAILDSLSMIAPRLSDGIGEREAALVALGSGVGVLSLVGPVLMLAGRPGAFSASRRRIARLHRAEETGSGSSMPGRRTIHAPHPSQTTEG
jgi:hypothetical protein